jgi:hypothetical protein
MLPARDNRFIFAGDTYDATNNHTGNLVTNGLMSGTMGTVTGTGVSGTAPDGWTLASDGVTNATAFGSSIAYTGSGYTNLKKVSLTLGGTGDGGGMDGAHGVFQLYQATSAGASSWQVGDTVVGEVEADWTFTAGAMVSVAVQLLAGSGTSLASDGLWNTATDYYTLGTDSALLRTDPIVIPGGTTTIYLNCQIQAATGALTGNTVNFARGSFRKTS